MSTEQDSEGQPSVERTWPVTVKLAQPIDFGKEHITSLEFRRGRMGDLKGIKLDAVPPMEQVLLVASRMCNRPLAALELLSDEDGAEVVELVLGFFARCLGAGKTR